jgi:hypothetical protein
LPTTGRKALSRLDVLERIEPQFRDRVFEAVIGAHNADEIRGNRGLQDQIQADMMLEAERICGDIGVMVKNGSIVWAMNAVEREQLEKAEIERQQGMLDYQLDLMKREVARQGESAEVKIQSQLDLTKLQQASEDELAHMVLNSEVSFIDAREKAARRQEPRRCSTKSRFFARNVPGKFENQLAESGHSSISPRKRRGCASSSGHRFPRPQSRRPNAQDGSADRCRHRRCKGGIQAAPDPRLGQDRTREPRRDGSHRAGPY